MLRLRVATAVVLVVAACGATRPPELRTAAGPPAVVRSTSAARASGFELADLPTAPPTTTTTTAPPPPPAPVVRQPAPVPPQESRRAGDCAGWASTIARYFPADQAATACRVLLCESRGDPAVANEHGSGASGLWQFLPSTWQSVTGLAPPAANYSGDQQTAAAADLWRSSGWGQWSCY